MKIDTHTVFVFRVTDPTKTLRNIQLCCNLSSNKYIIVIIYRENSRKWIVKFEKVTTIDRKYQRTENSYREFVEPVHSDFQETYLCVFHESN